MDKWVGEVYVMDWAAVLLLLLPLANLVNVWLCPVGIVRLEMGNNSMSLI